MPSAQPFQGPPQTVCAVQESDSAMTEFEQILNSDPAAFAVIRHNVERTVYRIIDRYAGNLYPLKKTCGTAGKNHDSPECIRQNIGKQIPAEDLHVASGLKKDLRGRPQYLIEIGTERVAIIPGHSQNSEQTVGTENRRRVTILSSGRQHFHPDRVAHIRMTVEYT